MAASKAAKIWRRTWIGACMVAATTLLLVLADREPDGWFLLGGGWALAALGVVEVSRMGRYAHLWLFPRLLPALVVALLLGLLRVADQGRTESVLFGWPAYRGNVVLEAALLAAVPWLVGSLRSVLTPAGSRGLASGLAVWAILPLTWLHHVRAEWGTSALVALIVLSKIGDTAGYFVGSAIGRSHPFPTISPGKTTAGCVASLVAGTLAGGACVALELLPEPRLGLLGGFLCGAAVNLAAQAGDLLESRVKRASGVKDSGTWFGPAGGVLDVTDSLLLTVPTAVLLWPLLFASPGG